MESSLEVVAAWRNVNVGRVNWHRPLHGARVRLNMSLRHREGPQWQERLTVRGGGKLNLADHESDLEDR